MKPDEIETINVYDFDKTLFWTHNAEEGKKRYEEIFKKKYPHTGWFGKEESLSDQLDIQPNKIMRNIYDSLKNDKTAINVLISNRTSHLKNRMIKFLSDRDYKFDAILLKKGSLTKPERLQLLWDNYQNVDKINIFDDLPAAIEQYKVMRSIYYIYRDDLIFNIFQVKPNNIIEI
jgi:hypothetical protein